MVVYICMLLCSIVLQDVFFFRQKTAYEMRISDWSSDVCSSDLLRLIGDYLRSTPDPDRGWAMAALTGDLDIKAIKPALIRALIEDRVDPVLFRMSRDYVGDTAETVALLWPGAIEGDSAELRL